MSKLMMPERKEDDGAVGVSRPRDGYVSITATTDGKMQNIECGEHNAWRIFGLLAVMLHIPLPTNIGKAIKF